MEENQLSLPFNQSGTTAEILKKEQKIKLNPIDVIKAMGTVVISAEAMYQIQYYLRKFPSNEWSGVLVYEVIKGDLLNIQDMVCYVRYVYLSDIGTGGYTEFTTSGDLMYLFDEYPKAIDMRLGFIHSHHGMGTSFSGTDMEELQENAPQHLYYLSLIVSHRPEFSAKLAFQGKKMSTHVQSFRNIDDQVQGTTYSMQSDVIFIANMNVYQEMDPSLEKRIVTVREIVTKRKTEMDALKKEADALQKNISKGKERAWTRDPAYYESFDKLLGKSPEKDKSKKKDQGSNGGKIKPKVPVKKATSWNAKTKEFSKFINADMAEMVVNVMLTGFSFGKIKSIFRAAEVMDSVDMEDYIQSLIDDNYDDMENWNYFIDQVFEEVNVPVEDVHYMAYEAFVKGCDNLVDEYKSFSREDVIKDVAEIAQEHFLARIEQDNS
jgi:hypothetical protein